MTSSKQPKAQPLPNEAPEKFRLLLDKNFLEDLQYWTATNPKVASKLLELIDAVPRDPFGRLGKPEPLKMDKSMGSGYWSRRITAEHRFVYRVETGCIYLLQGRYHY